MAVTAAMTATAGRRRTRPATRTRAGTGHHGVAHGAAERVADGGDGDAEPVADVPARRKFAEHLITMKKRRDVAVS